MNILIVEDSPTTNVQDAIDYLTKTELDFTYNIFTCIASAFKYMSKYIHEIDVVIVGLKIRWFDGSPIESPIEGLKVVRELNVETKDVPVIINSSAKIEGPRGESEEECLKRYESKIEHVPSLDGKFLYDFIKENVKC